MVAPPVRRSVEEIGDVVGTTTLSSSERQDDLLAAANRAFARRYRGEGASHQPVHTVYGGAHLFRADVATRLGGIALRTLERFAPDPRAFATVLGIPTDLADVVYERVRLRLEHEPVEDYRIDFEDGYGVRSDSEEDTHAVAAAREVSSGAQGQLLPRFIGIRVKPLNEEWKARSIRTLGLFLRALPAESLQSLRGRLRLTLPKITRAEQVQYFATRLDALERELRLEARTLTFEIMVETPQLIVDAEGRCPLPAVIEAAQGRITAAHFGTYDYSAACGIAAHHQRMQHETCQHALRVMQAVLAGTGVWLSDGATTQLPIPTHREREGNKLSSEQEQENTRSVHAAWRLHYDDVRHSLMNGFYQGWDLHPAQLPTRYAAVTAFYLEGLDAAADRLRNFVDRGAQSTLAGNTFDDAATGQGLLNYFLRAIGAGAVSEAEVFARTGLTSEELAGRSFVAIVQRRTETRGSTSR